MSRFECRRKRDQSTCHIRVPDTIMAAAAGQNSSSRVQFHTSAITLSTIALMSATGSMIFRSCLLTQSPYRGLVPKVLGNYAQ